MKRPPPRSTLFPYTTLFRSLPHLLTLWVCKLLMLICILTKNVITSCSVRFPPTATKEIQYLNAKGALTYTDIAGDPVLYGNLPPREISMKDVFRSGDSSKKFKIAEGQWYRYAPSYVSPAYHLLEGFPFIQEPPSGDLQERVLIRHHDYDQCFQSVQLLQWNSQ